MADADPAGDVLHGQTAFPQKLFGSLYPAADEILMDAHAHTARKFSGKVILAYIQVAGNPVQAQRFRIMGLEKKNRVMNGIRQPERRP